MKKEEKNWYGILAYGQNGPIAVINKNGIIGLPGGGPLSVDESPLKTALREFREETGIKLFERMVYKHPIWDGPIDGLTKNSYTIFKLKENLSFLKSPITDEDIIEAKSYNSNYFFNCLIEDGYFNFLHARILKKLRSKLAA